MSENLIVATETFVVGDGATVGMSAKDADGNMAGFVLRPALMEDTVIRLLRHLALTGLKAPPHEPDREVETVPCTSLTPGAGDAGRAFLVIEFGPLRLPVLIGQASLRPLAAQLVRTAQVMEAKPGQA